MMAVDIKSEQIQNLIKKAQEAYANAYVPYSHYPVGAAVLFRSGKEYTGANIENASFGLTICAERNAIFHAAAEGERAIECVVVAVPTEDFPSPCGACRQVIREFAQDCPVILVNRLGKTKVTSLRELLPESFGPEYL